MQSGRQQVMSSRRMAVSHGGSVVQWVRPDTVFFQSLVLHKTCSSNCICTAVKSENAEPFASTEAWFSAPSVALNVRSKKDKEAYRAMQFWQLLPRLDVSQNQTVEIIIEVLQQLAAQLSGQDVGIWQEDFPWPVPDIGFKRPSSRLLKTLGQETRWHLYILPIPGHHAGQKKPQNHHLITSKKVGYWRRIALTRQAWSKSRSHADRQM